MLPTGSLATHLLTLPVTLAALAATGCVSRAPLPGDVPGYQSRCVKLNPAPIARYDGDPHQGVKNVYACNVPEDALRTNTRPFPSGTLIVKESTREGQPQPWLVATARKQPGGEWRWDEYTRDSAHEPFLRILAPEAVCTGCHDTAEDDDWIFTRYSR